MTSKVSKIKNLKHQNSARNTGGKKIKFLPLVLVFAGLAVFAAACSSDSSDSASSPETIFVDSAPSVDASSSAVSSTYDAPGALELTLPVPDAAPGTIFDSERLSLPGGQVGYRILYASRSLREDPIGVSGYVITPGGTPPEGGWPLVAWAHGTVGMADQCAPSRNVETDTALWSMVVDRGFAIVATDYEGLGTPGLHPYIVGKSEARSVFDSVRAVQNHGGDLDGIQVSSKWVTWGHSQGGHAAMHVAQNHQDYAPELELLGSVAGAPASQFNLLYNVLVGGPFQGYVVMATAAFEAAYDGVDLSLVSGPKVLERLTILEEGCLNDIFAAFNDLTREELSIVDNPLEVEPIKSITAENDSNKLPVSVPTLIIHGSEDEQIPVVSSQFLLAQLCSLEGNKELQRLLFQGETHGSVVAAAADDMFEWIQARFDGDPAPTNCG